MNFNSSNFNATLSYQINEFTPDLFDISLNPGDNSNVIRAKISAILGFCPIEIRFISNGARVNRQVALQEGSAGANVCIKIHKFAPWIFRLSRAETAYHSGTLAIGGFFETCTKG